MPLTLRVPALGESVQEATLGAWKHAEGDEISADEPLVEVESEKATLEVPSPGAGVLSRILRKAGETVAVGEVIAEIDQVGQAAQAGHAPAAAAPPSGKDGNGQGAPGLSSVPANEGPVRAPPSARRALSESGLSPAEVKGTGRGGRISKQDVERAVEARTHGGGGAASEEAALVSAPEIA